MSSGVAHETKLDRAVRRLRENDSSFKRLDLWGENIGDEGVSVLANALQVNTSLMWLSLSGNGIGGGGMIVLAYALQVHTSLTGLHLGNNGIGDEGVTVLANALRVNTSLTELYLGDNSIGHRGLRVLADALRVNTSLKRLDFSDNSIGDEGVSVLADALWVNTSLTALSLGGNNFSDEGEVLERRVDELTDINREAESPHAALGQKVELIMDSNGDTIEDAMSLALAGLERFSESDQRWEILGASLGRREHGRDVAKALDLSTGLDMYRLAAKCGAGPAVVNLLRAQPSLCDEEEQGGLYPFMLLATMPTVEVGNVFEVLLMKPDLVASAITMT